MSSSEVATAPAISNRYDSEFYDQGHFKPAQVTRSWTPTALPKPLHLSEGTLSQAVVQSQIAAERMRQNAQESALVERMSMDEVGLEQLRRTATAVPVRTETPAAAATARLAGMGIIENSESAELDLDAVLRRRRAG